jgi:hypothetical protein
MKRLITVILMIALVVALPLTAFADVDTLDPNAKKSSSSNVNGTFESTDPDVYTVKPDDKGNFKVDNGKDTITVDPVSDRSKYKVVVRFFSPTDEEALDWIAGAVDGLHEDILPFEIYYLDQNGNRVELEKGDVVTVAPVNATDIVLKSVAPDGRVVDVPFTVKDGVLTFKAPGGKFCYYALSGKAPLNPAPSPDTGVAFDDVFWFAIMGISGSALGMLLLLRKRQMDLEVM